MRYQIDSKMVGETRVTVEAETLTDRSEVINIYICSDTEQTAIYCADIKAAMKIFSQLTNPFAVVDISTTAIR